MELATPTGKPIMSWMYTTVLFITNRERDKAAFDNSKNEGNYDLYFPNKSDDSVFVGEACVSYPTNRVSAEQDYHDNSADLESPAINFVIKGFLPIRYSAVDFKLAVDGKLSPDFETHCPADFAGSETTPAVFIHGWRASFTSGITRGAQLKLDLHRKYLVVVSWPADKLGIFDLGYGSAEEEEKRSKVLVEDIMVLIHDSINEMLSVIAHSMGARLYIDGIMSWFDQTHHIPTNTKGTILAAPDVDFRAFQQEVRTFELMNEYTTVYCGNDLTLDLSGFRHLGPRLGYCSEGAIIPAAPEELVRVTGRFDDVWRHSYFLSSPDMIIDMENVLFKDERRVYPREGAEIPSRTLRLK